MQNFGFFNEFMRLELEVCVEVIETEGLNIFFHSTLGTIYRSYDTRQIVPQANTRTNQSYLHGLQLPADVTLTQQRK